MNVDETTWSLLQDIRAACAGEHEDRELLAVRSDGFEFVRASMSPAGPDADFLFSPSLIDFDGWSVQPIIEDRLFMYVKPHADSRLAEILRIYIPICAAAYFFPQQSFVVAHMAQSLDGKVATESADSKWIGNQANLVHAHRLRALVDGVLVGGVTARRDLPSLNVRHVNGSNPARIVLSNSFTAVDELPVIPGMDNILVRCPAGPGLAPASTEFRELHYDGQPGKADIPLLLRSLRDQGMQTILLEGGPKTFESFLSAGAVDWLQLHIAPLLFGSGKSMLSLPAISTVDDARRLRNSFCVDMDGDMMITGQV